MASGVAGRYPSAPSPARTIRVLRWTYRRGDESVVCELGLNSDDSAYQLNLNAPSNAATVTTETFGDVTSAFERHAAFEKVLAEEGWLLEAFQSEEIAR
jgi:hypothetical protein